MLPRPVSTAHLFYLAWVMALTVANGNAQTAGNFPSKPIRIIAPYAPPGGAIVLSGRIIFDKVGEDLGRPIIFDHRAGGNTVIGTLAAVRSTPDGHSLLAVTNTIAINSWLQPNLPYDTMKDLVAVSTLSSDESALTLHSTVPGNNLREFIAYARQNPGKLNARIQTGTFSHLTMALLMQATDTKLTLVSYKGSGDALADMLSGQLHVAMTSQTNVIPHIRSGRLKGLAISGNRRSSGIPEVPTFTEAGLKDFKAGSLWHMLLAPAGTPRAIVEKLNSIVAAAQASKTVQDHLAKVNLAPFPNSVSATNALLRTETETFGKVIRDNNIKAED